MDYSAAPPPPGLATGLVMPPPAPVPSHTMPVDDGKAPVDEPVDMMAAIRKAKERAEQLKKEAAEGKKRKREDDDGGAERAKMQQGIFTLVSSTITIDGRFAEEYYMPNNNVGRVIGKGGEQINRMQDMSMCRIQIAQDNGSMYRSLSLTGERRAIDHAKQLITDIVNEGTAREMDVSMLVTNGQPIAHAEVMIPSHRVGMIIGRSGETIKRLQDESGARLQMIQDDPSADLKPLKIAGTAEAVARAEKMVRDMLDERDPHSDGALVAVGNLDMAPLGSSGGPDHEDEYRSQVKEIPVPRWAVGSVIGRAGETIKRIQIDSGARVQFNHDTDMATDHRICTVAGTMDMVRCAERIVHQIIREAETRGESDGPGGRRGSTGGHYGPPGGRDGGGHYGPPGGGRNEKRIRVPAPVCGLVIGRGGESIKEIQGRSGAHVELDRNHAPDATEKEFVLRGSDDQIAEAERLINMKVEEDRDRRMGRDRGGGGGPPQGGGYGMPSLGLPPPHMLGAPNPMMGAAPMMGGYGAMMGAYPQYGGAPAAGGFADPQAYANSATSSAGSAAATQQASGAASASGAGAAPAPGYPTDEEYRANIAWYNSQGYFGVVPTEQPAPAATAAAQPANGADATAAAPAPTEPAPGADQPPAPGYPTDAEYKANIAWYNSQGYFGVPGQQGPAS